MNRAGVPIVKDLVLIGGGHAHVTVLKRFGMKPIPGVQLTLISPDAHTPYSGMLPGLIAGHYTFDEAHIDLVPLARFAGARFICAAVERVDPERRLVFIAGRPPLPYDVLSINAGSTPSPEMVPGAAERVIPVKPVAQFLDQWAALQDRVSANPGCQIGVVGAGAGGVELILSAQFAITARLGAAGARDQAQFHVITRGDDILDTHNARVRARFRRILKKRGINVHTGFNVTHVDQRGVHAGPKTVALDEIFWVTGANAPPWIAASGFDTDDLGFMAVAPTLQSLSHTGVFAAGDIAAVSGYPRPKSGVFAVRHGPPLEANLRRSILGKQPKNFRPQRAFLSLISTGGQHAVASRSNWGFSGHWVWRWKDHIDRSFMAKFNTLPAMAPVDAQAPLPKLPPALITRELEHQLGPTEMRCGGCGAKVGAVTLQNVLGQIEVANGSGIIAGLDAADDAAIIAPPQDRELVQSVDFFRAMVEDPFVFGQIAANHCLGDIYAMNGAPHSAMAIATLPFGLPEKTEAMLSQLMAGANRVLKEAGCALIGGHTGEGSELSLGFAVTGLIESGRALRKNGLVEGQALILTKALGTGALFAADMRAKAKGRWLVGAVRCACQSNRMAAKILDRHGAAAATDVTGFGLVGHLSEMLDASRAIATVNLAAVPALDGALETLSVGIVSSLQDQNLRQETIIANRHDHRTTARYQLLFDPQTAGGLLAAVPGETAHGCIRDLHGAGYDDAAVIGYVSGAAPDRAIEIRLR